MTTFTYVVASVLLVLAMTTSPSSTLSGGGGGGGMMLLQPVDAQTTITNTSLCRALNVTLAPYCASMVTSLVPTDTNETFYDRTAESVVTGPLYLNTCSYFSIKEYQCRKLFPSCVVEETTSGSTVVQSAKIDKLCDSICDTAKLWNGAACKKVYSDAYWASECEDLPFYTSDTTCTIIAGRSAEADDADTWKYIVAGVCGAIGVGLIIAFLYQYCREKGVGVDSNAASHNDATVNRTAQEPKSWAAAQSAEQQTLVSTSATTANGRAPSGNSVVPV